MTTVDPGREDLREQIARAMHTRNIGEDCWDELLESGPKRQVEVYRDAADAVLPIIDELHERARRMADVANGFSVENARLRAAMEELLADAPPRDSPLSTIRHGRKQAHNLYDPDGQQIGAMFTVDWGRRIVAGYNAGVANSQLLQAAPNVGADDETPEPRPMRAWQQGDPWPDDVTMVRDSGDRRWCLAYTDNSWYLRDIVGPVYKWDALLRVVGPLTEVRLSSDVGTTIEDDDGGRWYVTRSTLRRASDVRDEVP